MKKAFKIVLILIGLLVLGIYFTGAYFFSNYFLPKTFINGRNLSFTRKSDLYKNYNDIFNDYKLNIISREGKESLDVGEFDYKDILLPNQEVKQYGLYWFLQALYTKKYDLKNNATYDLEKFDRAVNNLNVVKNQNIPPKDARIVFINDKFSIEDEVLGNNIRINAFKASILKHLKENNKNLSLEEENIYKLPKVRADDPSLESLLDEYKTLNNITLSYNFEDRKEELKGQDLIKLFMKTDDYKLRPDPEKVKAYVKNLAAKYDTFKGTRDFNATGIGPVRISGGIYGWSTEISKTSDELLKALEERKDKVLTPAYKTVAQSRKVDDLGNSYIEIDIARQNAWLYRDGNLIIETKVVTGNTNLGNGTPTGTHKIWSRERDRFLTGEDYKSFVNYWLPINWQGVGLHDASWRKDFGGDIYLTRGSHGCINIPSNLMPKIFENTFIGMPVVVYDSAKQKLPANENGS